MNLNLVNPVTENLAPYPMEELARIKKQLKEDGSTFYDFGTGDPQIPTWPKVSDTLKNNITQISQYPSIAGRQELQDAQYNYVQRRLGLKKNEHWNITPTRGSKEAVFHIALSLVGREGRKKIIYPNPGYPVYKSSILFAGGTPTPINLREENGYLLEPWTQPKELVSNAAAIWVNYPNNPTGACAPRSYWEKLIDWCHETNTILLSDDCYLDIFASSLDKQNGIDHLPVNPLSISQDRVLSFMSLSKRSGMTGYRAGMIAGDSRILNAHIRARANFGLGQPDFIQHAAIEAWNDDEHVKERRKIFDERIDIASKELVEMGLLEKRPEATFYLWCKVPPSFTGQDKKFCLQLASHGVISTPSSWLGDQISGYFRLALVPNNEDILKAMSIIKKFITNT